MSQEKGHIGTKVTPAHSLGDLLAFLESKPKSHLFQDQLRVYKEEGLNV